MIFKALNDAVYFVFEKSAIEFFDSIKVAGIGKKYGGTVLGHGVIFDVKAVGIPTVEVHLSDINARDEFRKFSYVSLVAKKTICGLGFEGYRKALAWFA